MAARVLIVEDNPANLELMTYLLNAFGYFTLIARDGLDGLRIANSELPDLIICDVQLPKMSGYEVARQAKRSAALHEIPLIAVTAFARASDRAEALAAGFDGYLAKPIDPETFVQQMEGFLTPGLHVATAIPTRSIAKSQPKPRTQQRTILIVDNVQANLDFSASLFEYFGYTVITALDAQKRCEAPGKHVRTSSCPMCAWLNAAAMTSSRTSRTTIAYLQFLSFSSRRQQSRNETACTG